MKKQDISLGDTINIDGKEFKVWRYDGENVGLIHFIDKTKFVVVSMTRTQYTEKKEQK